MFVIFLFVAEKVSLEDRSGVSASSCVHASKLLGALSIADPVEYRRRGLSTLAPATKMWI